MSSYSSTDISLGVIQDAVARRSASQAASVIESEETNDASESRGPLLCALARIALEEVSVSSKLHSMSWLVHSVPRGALGLPRRETTVLTPFLIEFFKLFQELESVSLPELRWACENVDDAQGSGATAPERIHGEEGQTGDGGGRIRRLTGDDQGT